MKKLTALIAASSLMTSVAATAFAGNLVEPEPAPEPIMVPEQPSTSLSAGAVVAGLAAIGLIAVLANDNNNNNNQGGAGTTSETRPASN